MDSPIRCDLFHFDAGAGSACIASKRGRKGTYHEFGIHPRGTSSLTRKSAQALARLLEDHPEYDRAQIKLEDQDLILPRTALALLRDLLTGTTQGHAVTVVPRHVELTTQQTAETLNVSRPYLIKLLKRGELAFSITGTHRRVRFYDVQAYKARQKADGRDRMAELARLAQESDLGY